MAFGAEQSGKATMAHLTSDNAQQEKVLSDGHDAKGCHSGARRDPLGERRGHFTERAALQRVDTGPVSSTGWHFRRYDGGWLNHISSVRLKIEQHQLVSGDGRIGLGSIGLQGA